MLLSAIHMLQALIFHEEKEPIPTGQSYLSPFGFQTYLFLSLFSKFFFLKHLNQVAVLSCAHSLRGHFKRHRCSLNNIPHRHTVPETAGVARRPFYCSSHFLHNLVSFFFLTPVQSFLYHSLLDILRLTLHKEISDVN